MNLKPTLEQAEEQNLALTFQDVRLRTSYSEILPVETTLTSWFSKNIPLKIPITSAAMDTVTESKMAIEIAKLGGIGVIHKNLNPKQQAEEVARVKHHLNALVEDPVYISDSITIADVLAMRRRKGYEFHSFPVLSKKGDIVGIMTENDFEFCDDNSQYVRDVMTSSLLTAPEDTTATKAYEIMKRKKKKVLPLVNEKGKLAGMYVLSDVKRIVLGNAENYNIDEKGRLRVAAAIGVKRDAYNRLEKLLAENVDVVVIDTAHGDSKAVIETLKSIKRNYSNLDVVVGNISERESALRLLDAGADGIKIGQGPGAICTTRIVAGVGMPQVSAVYACAKAAEGYSVPVCADGGIQFSGDIPIAIAAGAHSVMMGNLLAGTDEAPGEIIQFDGKVWKGYRGMGSIAAMEANRASRERYGQKEVSSSKELVAQGVEGVVPYRGKLSGIMIQYLGGLRNGMGYLGTKSIEDLRKNGQFIRITAAGLKESHPSVAMIKEPPNYSGGAAK